MKKQIIIVVALATVAANLYAGTPADLSVGWGRAMTPGDPLADLPANFGAYFTEISGITSLVQDIEIPGEDITFTLSVEAANASLITGDGTSGLINSRSTGEDVCIIGGDSDIRTDARGPGSADDEGLRLTLSVSGVGVTNITDISMDFLRIRRFADSGPESQVTLYDSTNRTGNSYIAQNTLDEFLGDFSYTDHSILTNEFIVTNLTALSSSNIGGIGDGSWVLEMYATDALTNSMFALGDVKVNFSLADYGNTPPEANDQNIETSANTPVDITLTASDQELDPLTFAILEAPTSGTVTGTAPNVTYLPELNFIGDDSFTFTASDGEFTSTGTVSIAVTPVYYYASFGEDYTLVDPTAVEWNWEIAETNVNTLTANGITFTVTFTGANDALSDDTVNNRSTGNDICISGGLNGLRIDPRGAGDSSDDEGLRMTISVSGENAHKLSSIKLDEFILRRYTEGTEVVHYYDGINAGGTAFATNHASATVSASELFDAGLTPLGTNNVGGIGDGSWVLEFWSRTDLQDFALGDIKIAYTMDLNLPPTAYDQAVETVVDTPVDITLTAEDVDPLTFAVLDAPANGTVTGTAPNVTYTPDTGFLGADSFTFTADDGEFTSTGTVSITVNPVYLIAGIGGRYSESDGDVFDPPIDIDYAADWPVSDDLGSVTTHSVTDTVNDIVFNVTLTSVLGNTIASQSTLEDVGILGGGSNYRIEGGEGAIAITLSVSGSGAANLYSLELERLHVRRWGDGETAVLSDGTTDLNLLGDYTDMLDYTGTLDAAQDISGLTALTVSNVTSWSLSLNSDGTSDPGIGSIGFRYSVTAVPYDYWAEGWGVDIGAITDDYEQDGMDNLLEYALGGNPTNDDASTVMPTASAGNDGWFYYVHNERTDDDSLSYTVKLKDNLVYGEWTTTGVVFHGESADIDSFKSVTNRTDVNSAEFLRLEVIRN